MNPHNAYALSKFEAEEGLRKIAFESGIDVVIIRPPLVYGANAPGNFKTLITAVKRGIPLPLGAIKNKRSFVFIGNLVSLVERCIAHPAAANQVFLVSDGHDLSTTELLRECALAQGVTPRLISIPQKWIELGAIILGKRELGVRLCGDLQVDISKAKTLLDWMPPYSVADGLKLTAETALHS